jgi:stress response protein YsnF
MRQDPRPLVYVASPWLCGLHGDEVPLCRESVSVQKQARVFEVVIASQQAVERTEQVTDTVRRAEVDEDATLIDDREGGTALS